MDYGDLRQELLIAIRGKKSQGQISQALGYRYNQAYKWESGNTQISWTDFLAYCKTCKAPIASAIKKSFSYASSIQDWSKLLQHFMGQNSLAEVATKLQVSRYTVSRWYNSKACPSLEVMLMAFHIASPDFYRFLELLVDIEKLPMVKQEIALLRKQQEAYIQFPWLSAFYSGLDLAEYKKLAQHSDQFLQEKTKLPLSIIQDTVQGLLEADLLEWNGKHLQPKLQRIGLHATLEGRRRATCYVNQRVLDGIENHFGFPQTRNSWKLFSLNAESYEKILEKYTKFFNDVGQIIDEGQKGADKIYIMNMNLVDFDLLPESSVKCRYTHKL